MSGCLTQHAYRKPSMLWSTAQHICRRPSMSWCLTQHSRKSRLAGEPVRSATTAMNDSTRSPASRLLRIESGRPDWLSSPGQSNPMDPTDQSNSTDSAGGQSMLWCLTQHSCRSRLAGEPDRSATTAVNDTTRSPASRRLQVDLLRQFNRVRQEGFKVCAHRK